jgi:hypothetical protein
LSEVIKTAKILTYGKHISISENKHKTTWKIIHSVTGHVVKRGDTEHLITSNSTKLNKQNITEILNDHFLTIADQTAIKANSKIDNNYPSINNKGFKSFLSQANSRNFSQMYSKPCTRRNRKYNPLTKNKGLLWI